MRLEEHFEWMVREKPGGKITCTRYTMSEEEARKRFPVYAEKVLSSRVERHIAETDAEIWRNQHGHIFERTPPKDCAS